MHVTREGSHTYHILIITTNVPLFHSAYSNTVNLSSIIFFLPARRYASAGLCDSNVSVCPSGAGSVKTMMIS